MNTQHPTERALKALIAVELLKHRKSLAIQLLSVAVVVGGGLLLGLLGTGFAAFALLAVGFAAVLSVPMGIFLDKVEGTMELLTSLPIPDSTLVAGRLIPMATLAVVTAALSAIAAAISLPEQVAISAHWVAVAAFASVWIGATALGSALIAVALRFRASDLMGRVLVIGMIVGWALLSALDRIFGDPLDVLQGILADPRAPWLASIGYVVVCAVTVVGSWFLARDGYRRFRPDPASMER